MRPIIALVGLLCAACMSVASAADLAAIADAHIQTDTPTTNYGSAGVFAVASNRTALVRFNPASVASTPGSNATLKVKVAVTKNASNAVTIRLVMGAWNETSVTYKTLPALSAPIASRAITAADLGKFVTFDISSVLAGWRANPATNFGIAIVAATPVPNLQFTSREGGAAPILTLEGSSATNQVTVAPSGGDYTSPITAADNAFQGDHWCGTPPCTMNIGPGTYPLSQTLRLPGGLRVIGSGIDQTTLIATQQITDVAVVTNADLLSDVTVMNIKPGGFQSMGVQAGSGSGNITPALTRVSIVATAPMQATGLSLVDPALLTDVKVVVNASQATWGMTYTYAPLLFTGCSIDAGGGNVSNYGILHYAIGAPFIFNMKSSSVTAWGSGAVFGIDFGNDGNGTITDSSVEARGDQEVVLMDVHGSVSSREFNITNSTLKSSAGAAFQVWNFRNAANDTRLTLDNTQIGTGAIVNFGDAGMMRLIMKHSQMVGEGGIVMSKKGGTVDISNSTIAANGAWLELDAGSVHATDSVLSSNSQFGPGVQATCARTWDGFGQFHATGCPTLSQ